MEANQKIKDRLLELQRTVNKLSRKLSTKNLYSSEQRQVFHDQLMEAKKEINDLTRKNPEVVSNSSSNIVAEHRDEQSFRLMNNKFYL